MNGAVEGEPQRDEFYLKLMVSLATADADPSRVVQVKRSRLYVDPHHVTTRRRALNPKRGLAQLLLLDKAVMHLEADLRWLDIVENRLDDIRRYPPPEPESRTRGRPKKG